jgi:hypothetical protein
MLVKEGYKPQNVTPYCAEVEMNESFENPLSGIQTGDWSEIKAALQTAKIDWANVDGNESLQRYIDAEERKFLETVILEKTREEIPVYEAKIDEMLSRHKQEKKALFDAYNGVKQEIKDKAKLTKSGLVPFEMREIADGRLISVVENGTKYYYLYNNYELKLCKVKQIIQGEIPFKEPVSRQPLPTNDENIANFENE